MKIMIMKGFIEQGGFRMYASKKMKSCSGFKALDCDTGFSYRRKASGSCKDSRL